MDTKLEDKIGYQIHNLVRKGDIKQAAELAYEEFGFKRAFKIYINAGRLDLAKKFSKANGHESDFNYLCRENKYKTKESKGPTGPPLNMDRKKRVRKDLETEISPSETEITIPKAEIEAEA